MPMTTNEIAKAVLRHAVDNCEVSGWDWIVECWDLESIEKELIRSKLTTVNEAIESFGRSARLWDDHRRVPVRGTEIF